VTEKSASIHDVVPAAPVARTAEPTSSTPGVPQLIGNFAMQRFVQGGGMPLDAALRASFQKSLGRDFSHVRVHAGADAAKSARDFHARAFTYGSDIAFADGQYQPNTPDGQRLIVHELTHVAQQEVRAPTVAAKPDTPVAASTSDPLEREADRTASQAVPLSLGWQPTIASQYPALIKLLPEPDISGLEAASELRYRIISSPEEMSAATGIAKTSVEVPLGTLLTPEAQFVDVDVWETFFGTVKEFGGVELEGELARNEIMRRYFARLGLSLSDPVQIELIDPEWKKGGPSRLLFSVNSQPLVETGGMIAPPDLTLTFGSIEPEILAVSDDADTVALAAQLVLELEEVVPLATKLIADATLNPADHALNEVRGMSQRLHHDWTFVEAFAKRNKPPLTQIAGLEAGYKKLLEEIGPAVDSATAWHEANPMGESLGMFNERIGTSLAGTGAEEWEEGGGHYVLGGLAYAGSFLMAFVDAGEKVLSLGFHDAATAVGEAYARGDISMNEGEDILWSAAWRALLTAAVTRGLGGAASRLGIATATRFGIAAGSMKFGVVSGAVGGAFTGAGSVAAQALLTSRKSDSFSTPMGQAIWDQGMPTGTDWLLGIGGGALLGAGGGVWNVRAANARLIGSVIDTPSGPMRIVAIMNNGAQVLEPVGGRVKVPPGGAGGKTVPVNPDWTPSKLIPAGELPPANLPGGAGTQLALPGPSGVPLAPLPTPAQATVSTYLQALRYGIAGSPSSLVSDYRNAAADPFLQGGIGDPFGVLQLGAPPQPFGLLPAGPQPLGMLPPGPQPFGFLPAPPPPSDVLLIPEARHIPGAPGIVVGGSSQKLGKNIMESFGMGRSTSFSGWQPHHIIPSEARIHPVIVKIGMNLDDPSNGIMLPNPSTATAGGWSLPTHQGYHSTYSDFVLAELDKIDVNLPVAVLQVKVYRLRELLLSGIQSGLPLYPGKGATPQMWTDFLYPPPGSR
jgi:hypothetical protein